MRSWIADAHHEIYIARREQRIVRRHWGSDRMGIGESDGLSRTACELFTMAFAILAAASCRSGERTAVEPVVDLTEIGSLVSIGDVESADTMALFTEIRDAAFHGSEIAVLDAAPPFVRFFDSNGRFTRAFVERGEGPGEARTPYALSVTTSGGLLLTERRRVTWLDSDGQAVRITRADGMRVRGAVFGCGHAAILLAGSLAYADSAGGLLRPAAAGDGLDTLLRIRTLRPNSRQAHPLFAAGEPEKLILYSEERTENRIIEVSCDGTVTDEIELDSIGRAEWWESGAVPGEFLLHPPEAPFPAGFARIGDELVWASRILKEGKTGVDTLTRLVSYRRSARDRSILLRGWYEILDASADGRVLISRDEPVGSVFVVDGRRLLMFLQERGASGNTE